MIVVALGAVMINRGLILTGSGADLGSLTARLRRPAIVELATPLQQEPAAPKIQTIEMEANRFGYKPNRFTLQRGVPVKWAIKATEITTCNNRIIVPSLKLEFDLKPGLQTIEFTPQEIGRHSLELLDGDDARRIRGRRRRAAAAVSISAARRAGA